MTYTLGPWKSHLEDTGWLIYAERQYPMAQGIAILKKHPPADDRMVTGEEISAGNARLISAAPDLLCAAKLMIDTIANLTSDEFSRGGDASARRVLIAAIDRAEGEEK